MTRLDLTKCSVDDATRVESIHVKLEVPPRMKVDSQRRVPVGMDSNGPPVDIHGLSLSFEVVFDSGRGPNNRVTLSTSPLAEPTHWKQSLMLFKVSMRRYFGETNIHHSISFI